jgi:hypothetical protein
MPSPHAKCGTPKRAGMRQTHYLPSCASLVQHVPNPRLAAIPLSHQKRFSLQIFLRNPSPLEKAPQEQKRCDPGHLPQRLPPNPPRPQWRTYPQSAAGSQTNLGRTPHRLQTIDSVLRTCTEGGQCPPGDDDSAQGLNQVRQTASTHRPNGRPGAHSRARSDREYAQRTQTHFPRTHFPMQAGVRTQRVAPRTRHLLLGRLKKRPRHSTPLRNPHPASS